MGEIMKGNRIWCCHAGVGSAGRPGPRIGGSRGVVDPCRDRHRGRRGRRDLGDGWGDVRRPGAPSGLRPSGGRDHPWDGNDLTAGTISRPDATRSELVFTVEVADDDPVLFCGPPETMRYAWFFHRDGGWLPSDFLLRAQRSAQAADPASTEPYFDVSRFTNLAPAAKRSRKCLGRWGIGPSPGRYRSRASGQRAEA